MITISGCDVPFLKQLGKGTYGSVFLINIDNRNRAVKIITEKADKGVESLQEIDIMTRILHPNIINSVGITVNVGDAINSTTVGIIMPVANADLYSLLKSPILNLSQRLSILRDITKGLKYLYDFGYLHLDVKPMNVLLFDDDNQITARITDFGIAQLMGANKTKNYPDELITITHRPPEILAGQRNYTMASDMWSLGITYLEVLSYGVEIYKVYDKETVIKTNKTLFSPAAITPTLKKYLSALPSPTREYGVELIKAMLRPVPEDRPNYTQVLDYPIFNHGINGIDNPIDLFSTYVLPNPPRECSELYYYGFDELINLYLKIPSTSVETFYLAVDIYQRSLAYANKLTGDRNNDWSNTLLLVLTAAYMAFKMLEPFTIKPSQLSTMSGGIVPENKILLTEAFLIQASEGKIYHRNMFTEAYNIDRLIDSFEVLRNCHIYHKVDLKAWTRDYIKNNIPENIYIPFKEFLPKTEYYKKYRNVSRPEIYIPLLYINDFK